MHKNASPFCQHTWLVIADVRDAARTRSLAAFDGCSADGIEADQSASMNQLRQMKLWDCNIAANPLPF